VTVSATVGVAPMTEPRRLFCDTSILTRYWTGDDPPRALAAARLVDRRDVILVLSTGVLLESVHVLRTEYGSGNPEVGTMLIEFLSRENVELTDADKPAAVEALRWSLDSSARRIADALLAAAAERARCDAIATFDEGLRSPSVRVQLL
jgi:predicted nucleic acid-binding protein